MSSLVLFLNEFYKVNMVLSHLFSFLVEGKKFVWIFFTFVHHMTPPTLASVPVNFLMTPPPPPDTEEENDFLSNYNYSDERS